MGNQVQTHLASECSRIVTLRTQGTCTNLWADAIPKEPLLAGFMGVDSNDVPALMRVCSSWRGLVKGRGLLERLQVCCFYTKVSSSEDVLGFGVSAEYHNDGNLKALSTELDVLSSAAFCKFNLRRGVWGDNFDFFLPLILDGNHGKRALSVLERSLAALVAGPKCVIQDFEPWMALVVLPQLMNSFAVSLMNAKDGVSRHTSEKALLGYCSFHHMLLALAAEHPSIAQVAHDKLRNFMRGGSGRHKSQTPDLGQPIVYCAVAEDSFDWRDIANAVVHESGVRGILWLLRENPRLESPNVSDSSLVIDSFRGRLTGLRLLMFQAFFLRHVACADGVTRCGALRRYNMQFGLPTSSQKETLFTAAREILAVGTWKGFYSRLGLPCPSNQQQASILREAIESSALSGYHTPSTKATRGRQQKTTRDSGLQRQRVQQFNVGEKVGVKQDLKKAFTNAANKTQARSKSTQVAIATSYPAPASEKAPAVLKRTISLQNKFAAMQSDSESD